MYPIINTACYWLCMIMVILAVGTSIYGVWVDDSNKILWKVYTTEGILFFGGLAAMLVNHFAPKIGG